MPLTQPIRGAIEWQFLCRTHREADRQQKLAVLAIATDAHPWTDGNGDQSSLAPARS
jgi:hypothetical protein